MPIVRKSVLRTLLLGKFINYHRTHKLFNLGSSGTPIQNGLASGLKISPPLVPTKIIREGVTPYVNGGCKDAHGNYRRFQGRKERDPKIRSKTFLGIAEAMAEQWGGICKRRYLCDR